MALASGASAIAACRLLTGGCALSSHESGAKDMLFDRDGVDIVTTSSSRQMVMIKDRDSVERYCRGPEPDSSLATTSGVFQHARPRPPPMGRSDHVRPRSTDFPTRRPSRSTPATRP